MLEELRVITIVEEQKIHTTRGQSHLVGTDQQETMLGHCLETLIQIMEDPVRELFLTVQRTVLWELTEDRLTTQGERAKQRLRCKQPLLLPMLDGIQISGI